MLIIEYSKNGLPTADSLSEEVVLNLIKEGVKHYHTSTDSIILAARVLALEGKIEKPIFLFEGKELDVDDNMRFTHYPNGFADTIDDLLNRIIAPFTKYQK